MRVLDLAIRVFGGLLATWTAVLLAVVETFLVPLRIGPVRAPVAVLLAIAGNVGLILFARWVTGNRYVALVPGAAWLVTVIVLGNRTTEGDIVLAGDDPVAVALLLLGSAAAAAGAYLAVSGLPRRRRLGTTAVSSPPPPPGRGQPDASRSPRIRPG